MRKRFSQIRLKTLQFSLGNQSKNGNVDSPDGHAKNNLFELQLKGIMDGDGYGGSVISLLFLFLITIILLLFELLRSQSTFLTLFQIKNDRTPRIKIESIL